MPTARAFVGRRHELAALAAALDAARAGEPRLLVIQGEAGIGKSSLILEFLRRHGTVPVLSAYGDEAEAVFPYGVVQQLAASALALSANALSGLKWLSRGPPEDANPLVVGVELLALISLLQRSEPVAVVLEDMHWADPQSAQALLFACRRLTADRVLVILSCRPPGLSQVSEAWERLTSGGERAARLTLGGLDLDELRGLCRVLGRAGLPGRVLRRLADQTGGNPLLARALLTELTDEELAAAEQTLSAPPSLTSLSMRRIAMLSSQARDLVLAAAVLGDDCALADVASVARAVSPAAALSEAVQSGFLVERSSTSGWTIGFPHLLVRGAVYGGLGPELRRTLHLRAAEISGRPEALLHRAAAAVGPDQELAGELDAAAKAAAAAGKLRLAASYFRQAAAASRPGPERDSRTLSAFESLISAADVAGAEAARPLIEQIPRTARRDAALGRLALFAARPLEAETLLRAAWDLHDPATGDAAGAEAAVGLGILLGMSGSAAESAVWLDRALSTATGTEPWYEAARSMRAMRYALAGEHGAALNMFSDLPARAAMVPDSRTDSLSYRGLVRLWTGDLRGATEDLGQAVRRISAGLPVGFPGQPLAHLAEAEFRQGRWDECREHADLAVSLAYDADRVYDLTFVHSVAARVPACRGDWAVAQNHVEMAEATAGTFGGMAAIYAGSARGILGLARDEPTQALLGAALAMTVPEIDSYDDPQAFWWRTTQIWALIRVGRLSQAEQVLGAFESRAAERSERLALINAGWLRGSLAAAQRDLDRAEQVLQESCQAAEAATLPFLSGLLKLEYGRCLSQLTRRRDAVAAISAARDTFVALGAHPFIKASELGLAALGVRRCRGDHPALPGLTAQELRVAQLVASGMSNREVAAQLYLSPKTVEFHLANAFTKVGVRTRHELTARILAAAGSPDVSGARQHPDASAEQSDPAATG